MLRYHCQAGPELLPFERTVHYITTFNFNFGPAFSLQHMDMRRFVVIRVEEKLKPSTINSVGIPCPGRVPVSQVNTRPFVLIHCDSISHFPTKDTR